jgi:hypothetical protein
MIKRVKKRAAKAGYAPEQNFVNEAKPGFSVERTTELQGADGQKKLIWIREKADKVNYEQLLESIGESLADYSGLGGSVPKPAFIEDTHISIYPMGDPHVGMYCWGEECGEDFDTEKATTQLVEAMNRLVDVSPPSKTALILNLGDFSTVIRLIMRLADQGIVSMWIPESARCGHWA